MNHLKRFKFLFLHMLISFNLLYAADEIPTQKFQRIISLAPNITEILFAIGEGDHLVGVTSYCDYPEEAKKISKIGGMINPSVEAIVSLKPDLVILTSDGNPLWIEEKLSALKIKTYHFNAHNFQTLGGEISKLATFLQASPALTSNLLKKLDLKDRRRSKFPITLLAIIWHSPLMIAGPNSFLSELFPYVGGVNAYVSHNKTKSINVNVNVNVNDYPILTTEEIIRLAPDFILLSEMGQQNVQLHKSIEEKWQKLLKAKKIPKFCVISDKLVRLGPRLVEGLEELRLCLRKKN